MKFVIIMAAILLSSAVFEDAALIWASDHHVPNPTITCKKVTNKHAYCDVMAHPIGKTGRTAGRVYPLTCYLYDKCHLRRR